MKVKTLEQLYLLCDDIYLSHSKVDIVKFYDDKHITISQEVKELSILTMCDYLYKVIVNAFKEHKGLNITFGSSYNKFTIILHMNLAL